MEGIAGGDRPVDVGLAEILARTLRHEVGDLLQTVYSTVAILQERLPATQALEKRLLTDLRYRAETCRNELDAVHDLVCPMTLKPALLDLAELAATLIRPFATRYPHIQVQLDAPAPLAIEADARRLSQCGSLLMLSAFQAAQHEVRVRVAAASPAEAEWSISEDGMGANPELLQWLEAPFTTTHQALGGLGLALARRVAEQHGGRLEAANLPAGGFRVALFLPRSK
jgi:two-component system nitrogen regulation sensor histidine kinase NtrY